MHSQSTALGDPIHGAFYQQEVGDPRAEGQLHQKSQTFPVCLACHAPMRPVPRAPSSMRSLHSRRA